MALSPSVCGRDKRDPFVILSVEEGMGNYPSSSLRSSELRSPADSSSLRMEIRTVQGMSKRGRKEEKRKSF